MTAPTHSMALTLDLDWAPDFAIEAAARHLVSTGVRATWFVTHETPVLQYLREHSELFELGIHPNFLPNSTQGSSVIEVLQHCMAIVPEALSMRTHALHQSTPIFRQVLAHTPVSVDLSLLLEGAAHLAPVVLRPQRGGRSLLRLPYFWEDDLAAHGEFDWHYVPLHTPGLQIYDFHPTYLSLNIDSMEPYEELKQLGALADRSPKDFAGFRHEGRGDWDFFLEVVGHLAGRGETHCVRDLAGRKRAGS